MESHGTLVWKLLAANDKGFPLNLADFTKLQRPLRLDAFEHYIRGLLASDDDARMRELREAARLDPNGQRPHLPSGKLISPDAIAIPLCRGSLMSLRQILVPRKRHSGSESAASSSISRKKPKKFFSRCRIVLKKAFVAGAELPEILNIWPWRKRAGETPPPPLPVCCAPWILTRRRRLYHSTSA